MERNISLSEAVDNWVAKNNIAQFKKQMEVETDESVRRVLVGLLEREEVKLKGSLDPLKG